MAGACVFGTIVSNTNTVLTEIGREATELAERMEGYQMLISSCRCAMFEIYMLKIRIDSNFGGDCQNLSCHVDCTLQHCQCHSQTIIGTDLDFLWERE